MPSFHTDVSELGFDGFVSYSYVVLFRSLAEQKEDCNYSSSGEFIVEMFYLGLEYYN